MHTLDGFRQLFSYDGWANREVLRSFRTAENPLARSLKLLSHILGTEYVWFSRIKGEKSALAVWPELTMIECERHATELPKIWSSYLDARDGHGLANQISYRNSKGESWSNSVEDILMHVVMHSAYHRGQIASDMRAAGHVPAYTDFIHGVRQGLVE